MSAPTQSITVKDPGVSTVAPANSIPCVAGPCSSGSANVMKSYSSITDLVSDNGQGQAVEMAAEILGKAGGPIRFMKLATSVASANGSVTKTAVGTSTGTVTVAGTAADDYEVEIDIKATGTVGVGTFAYSLDDGKTYSETLTIPSGGTYVVPSTGLTLTFVPGAGPTFFEKGDHHSFDSTAAMWNASDLANGVTALLADSSKWNFLCLAGKHATAAAANTIFAALDTHLTSFANQFRYVRAMMDGGKEGDAATITAFTNTSRRILVAYNDSEVASAKPMAGWSNPQRPSVNEMAVRASSQLVSTDLARYKSGPLTGVTAILYDEFKKATMDDQKFSTLRTFQGVEGFFICNARFKSPAGSDFEFWQHGRVMDEACRVLYESQLKFLSAGVRVNADGTIDERDAVRIEKEVQADLDAVLLEPRNAEGFNGHVTALVYTISRTAEVLKSRNLVSELAIRPLGYPKLVTTAVGYATAVAA